MPKIYAVINQKGGVGKSTTALALCGFLSRKGYQVLAVDLDAQGNLSYTLGAGEEQPGSLELLSGTPVAACIQRLPAVDLIAASPALAGADVSLAATGKEFRLREGLEPVAGQYDYILVDTPPALGILTINALTASTGAIIPAQADIYSLQGIGQLYGTLSAVRRYTNPALRILGILLTRYNPRAILTRDITEMIEATAKQLETGVFDAKIRESVAVKEAQASQMDLFAYAPRSNAALDYEAFAQELLALDQ